MNLRQWYANGYAQDAFRLTKRTTVDYGVRYEYMSALVDIKYTNSNLTGLRAGHADCGGMV